MHNEILLSVIIPVYNCEKYLSECINSVLESKNDSIEVIAVDDGSIDKSGEILDEFAENDSRVKAFHKSNSGVSDTRNYGLDMARGKMVMFLDADDIIPSGAVDTIVKKCSEVDAGIYIGNYTEIDSDCNKLWEFNIGSEINNNLETAYEKLVTGYKLNACWGKIYNLEQIRSLSLKFDKSMKVGEDLKFVAQYLENVTSICSIDECIYLYRQLNSGAVVSNRVTLNDVAVSNFIDTVKIKESFARKMNCSAETVAKMQLENVSNVMAMINYVLKNNSMNVKDRKRAVNAFVKNKDIETIIEKAKHSSDCSIKRRIVLDIVQNKMFRSVYCNIKMLAH